MKRIFKHPLRQLLLIACAAVLAAGLLFRPSEKDSDRKSVV